MLSEVCVSASLRAVSAQLLMELGVGKRVPWLTVGFKCAVFLLSYAVGLCLATSVRMPITALDEVVQLPSLVAVCLVMVYL